MDSYNKIFPNKHTVLPVIHASSLEQVNYNAQISKDAGADGVFIINHSIRVDQLWSFAKHIAKLYPDWFIGVNCLGQDPLRTLSTITKNISGIWVDNAEIDENQINQEFAGNLWYYRQETRQDWPGLYFGGVAFKYQKEVTDYALAARIATSYMDVVTTSGPATGSAASIDKIKTMKQAIGNFPLAIASGITPDNICNYLPYADCFLVATGISKNFEELDSSKIKQLVQIARTWKEV